MKFNHQYTILFDKSADGSEGTADNAVNTEESSVHEGIYLGSVSSSGTIDTPTYSDAANRNLKAVNNLGKGPDTRTIVVMILIILALAAAVIFVVLPLIRKELTNKDSLTPSQEVVQSETQSPEVADTTASENTPEPEIPTVVSYCLSWYINDGEMRYIGKTDNQYKDAFCYYKVSQRGNETTITPSDYFPLPLRYDNFERIFTFDSNGKIEKIVYKNEIGTEVQTLTKADGDYFAFSNKCSVFSPVPSARQVNPLMSFSIEKAADTNADNVSKIRFDGMKIIYYNSNNKKICTCTTNASSKGKIETRTYSFDGDDAFILMYSYKNDNISSIRFNGKDFIKYETNKDKINVSLYKNNVDPTQNAFISSLPAYSKMEIVKGNKDKNTMYTVTVEPQISGYSKRVITIYDDKYQVLSYQKDGKNYSFLAGVAIEFDEVQIKVTDINENGNPKKYPMYAKSLDAYMQLHVREI